MRPNPRVAIVTKSFVNKMLKVSDSAKKQAESAVSDKEAHMIGERMAVVARNFFPEVRLIKMEELYNCQTRNRNIFSDIDLVLPVGGDGTFLSCAYFIPKNTKVIFGVNSNPKKSLGFLLGMPFEEPWEQKVEELFTSISNGNFELFHRKRFLVHSPQLRNFCGNEFSSKGEALIGLNDLFFSSYNQAQTSRYHFTNGDKTDQNVRSTGCLIYTGSGSSAWAFGMNKVPDHTIGHILDYLKLPKTNIKELQKHLHQSFIFPSKLQRLAFKHREPTILSKDFEEQGFGKRFAIENLTFEGCLSVDGFEYFLDYGERLTVELADVEHDLLCLRPNACKDEECVRKVQDGFGLQSTHKP